MIGLPIVQLKTIRICYSDDLKLVFLMEEENRVSSLWAKFTETEYHLMHLLLTGEAYTDEELLNALHIGYLIDVEKFLRRNIDNIRSKMRPLGLNIYRVSLYGYI